MTLYGIPTCDTCRKALAALRAAGLEPVFRNVRADPLSQAEISRIVDEFGTRVINRTSPTFRSFNAFLRESEPEAQMAAQPTVMKRPVIEHEGRWFLGWDADVQAALLPQDG